MCVRERTGGEREEREGGREGEREREIIDTCTHIYTCTHTNTHTHQGMDGESGATGFCDFYNYGAADGM